jgi:hypothetical protein
MSAGFQHQSLAGGRWFSLTLAEQLGNIGSEVHRAIKARGDASRYDRSVDRGLELFDLTMSDRRWRKRLKEIARARELFCHAAFGSNEHGTTLEDLDAYFQHFAVAAQLERQKKFLEHPSP